MEGSLTEVIPEQRMGGGERTASAKAVGQSEELMRECREVSERSEGASGHG